MFNFAILIGRLTKAPELRYTPNGIATATFTLAIDRPFVNQQGQRETDFIKIVTWRNLAESCANYLGKGRLVAVAGRIQTRSYEDQSGVKHYVTEIVAENVRFLDFPKEQEQPQPQPQSQYQPQPQSQQQQAPQGQQVQGQGKQGGLAQQRQQQQQQQYPSSDPFEVSDPFGGSLPFEESLPFEAPF